MSDPDIDPKIYRNDTGMRTNPVVVVCIALIVFMMLGFWEYTRRQSATTQGNASVETGLRTAPNRPAPASSGK